MNPARIYSFQSAFIYGRYFWRNDTIEIDDTYVTIKKRQHPFSALKVISIPLHNIIIVDVKRVGTGASILIKSYAKSEIFCRGLSFKNAQKIKSLILS